MSNDTFVKYMLLSKYLEEEGSPILQAFCEELTIICKDYFKKDFEQLQEIQEFHQVSLKTLH